MKLLRHLGILSGLLLAFLASGCSKEVKFGAVISESGAVSSYGMKVRKGLDLALAELADSEALPGGSIQLIYKDDMTNLDRGRQVTQELIEQDQVTAIIGAVSSTVTLGIATICEEQGVILLSPSSSVTEISDAGGFIFRNWPSDILEGTAMAKFARDLGLEKVAVFAHADRFGEGLRDVFTSQYQGKFRSIVKVFDFQPGQSDFEAMAQEVKALEPDGIYIAAYLEDVASLLGALKAADVKAVLMGTSSITQDLIQKAGDAAENLVYPQPNFDLESTDPAISRFVAAYRARYNEDPDVYAAHGYDALKLLVEAVNLGGSAHPRDIKLGLSSIKDYRGAAGLTVFNADGDVVRYPRIFIIREGQSMPYEKFVEAGGSLFSGT